MSAANFPPSSKIEQPQQSMLARLSGELARIEKRDWELWAVVLGTGIAGIVGFLVMAFPSAILSDGGQLHLEIYVSRELFLGLITLLVLFNTYIILKRMELRKTREQVITTTIQSELVRLQSFTDPLTEVYNRRSLDEMAGRFISHARRSGAPLSFLLIDVDNFKDVNTRFGHLTGDLVITEVASLLKTSVRGCDAVVRYGGDEFLLILDDSTAKGAAAVVARIGKSVDGWNLAKQLDGYTLGLSIGTAEWKDGRTLDEVLDEADQKMYSQKTKAL